MDRTCERCGRGFQAGPRARYCGSSCRARASEARSRGEEPRLPAVSERPAGEAPGGGVLAAVGRELVAAGRDGSAAGQVALALAGLIDSRGESGAAVAALARQLSASMAEALRDAESGGDAVDDLAARREARRAAG